MFPINFFKNNLRRKRLVQSLLCASFQLELLDAILRGQKRAIYSGSLFLQRAGQRYESVLYKVAREFVGSDVFAILTGKR